MGVEPEVLSLDTLKAGYGTSTPRRQFLFERLRSKESSTYSQETERNNRNRYWR